jgi:hypothetical protein
MSLPGAELRGIKPDFRIKLKMNISPGPAKYSSAYIVKQDFSAFGKSELVRNTSGLLEFR